MGMPHALTCTMANGISERDPRTHGLIGAAMEVHNVLGCGFGHMVYRDAFAVELQLRGIPFMTEVPFPIVYKEHRLPDFYRADFLCDDSVVVEIKAINVKTGDTEQGQMLKYLRASGKTLGLLFNFGLPRLEYRRFIRSADRSESQGGSRPSSKLGRPLS